MTEIEQLKAELERVKRQAAAMRLALQQANLALADAVLFPGDQFSMARTATAEALKDTAGSEPLTREQVQPLVDMLKAVFECSGYFKEWFTPYNKGRLEAALAHARSLGLTDPRP